MRTFEAFGIKGKTSSARNFVVVEKAGPHRLWIVKRSNNLAVAQRAQRKNFEDTGRPTATIALYYSDSIPSEIVSASEGEVR